MQSVQSSANPGGGSRRHYIRLGITLGMTAAVLTALWLWTREPPDDMTYIRWGLQFHEGVTPEESQRLATAAQQEALANSSRHQIYRENLDLIWLRNPLVVPDQPYRLRWGLITVPVAGGFLVAGAVLLIGNLRRDWLHGVV